VDVKLRRVEGVTLFENIRERLDEENICTEERGSDVRLKKIK
jgi:hypothetical protein